jgi:hypothetical protein
MSRTMGEWCRLDTRPGEERFSKDSIAGTRIRIAGEAPVGQTARTAKRQGDSCQFALILIPRTGPVAGSSVWHRLNYWLDSCV